VPLQIAGMIEWSPTYIIIPRVTPKHPRRFDQQASGVGADVCIGQVKRRPLMQFLRTWLINHIGGRDKSYAPFLVEKGVS
jgi:hypothetical protein